ncbi:MAG TPA: HAMP domain-containing protein, partial [Rhodopila sp.]|nr:HAMP domain-containing protein [Rhodopila sp.]
MKLSTRLVLLVLGCLLPILTAQIYSQINLYAERHEQLAELVLRQAELANADITSVLDSVHQLGALAAQFPSMRTPSERCSQRLTALRESLPQYRFLALFSPADGALVCASEQAPPGLSGGHTPWLQDLLSTAGLSVGHLASDPDVTGRFLPIAVRLAGIETDDESRVLLAALDADWLAQHMQTARASRTPAIAGAALIVTDRDGNILGQVPDTGATAGQSLPAWLRPLVARRSQGVDTIVDPFGHTIVAAYVPNALSLTGLTIINALVLPELTADIDQATYQDLLVIGGAALVALILAWVAGRRFIYQPTEALLRAARRWREGDLGARAKLNDVGSEFAALAQSFNAMAAGLQAREMERRMQSSFLEAQVAERTRELSESNNRLQVEIAGREKTEAALHQAQKLQAVGQLAGGIAHDFNNMLATVLGNLELMERRVSQAADDWTEADTERLQRLIERATGAVTRGGQLTSRLL